MFTMPSWSASLASMRRPVRTSSIARCLPITRGEALGAAAARDDPERDLRLPELGGLGGDDQVAEQRELAAPAQGETRHRRDDRRAGGGDPLPERHRRAVQHVLERALRHRLDVRAGREHLVAPGEHDAVDAVVGVERVDRRGELLHELRRERVARLRAVERDDPDRAVLLDLDLGHRLLTPGSAR